MFVKLVKGKTETTYQCTHVQVTDLHGKVRVELIPNEFSINIPGDGEIVYLMNDQGDTTDSYPKKVNRKEFRA